MMIGAGVQPVPGPTLPDSSSAARNAWLRNGSPPASRSQTAGSMWATPGARRAISSVSRSAIGFPDKSVGVNPRLLALRGVADRPAVDRYSLAGAGDPSAAKRSPVDREEIRRRELQRQPPLQRRSP